MPTLPLFNDRRHSQSGFTIIELLTVVALVAILSVVGTSILVNAQIRGTKATTLSRIRTDGVFLLDRMVYHIRGASFLVPNQSGITCQADMSALRTRQHDGSELEFYRNGSNQLVQRTIANGVSTDVVLSSTGVRITTLEFDCQQGAADSGALIRVAFTLETGTAGATGEQDFSQLFETQVAVRSGR